jgi:SRSO17 transposase
MMNAMARQFAARSANWQSDLQIGFARIGQHFGRQAMRQRALDYVTGLLSPIERKTSWQLSEAVNRQTPYSLQHLLDRARWDADAVRDDLRTYVIEHLGEPDAVLVVDETGFLKKGRHSVGVQRQYSGTAGRIENCQIGVFLAYASQRGRVLMDRELYLPKEWAGDTVRRAAAKVPETVEFATKPQLAQRMIERAVAAQVPFAWITGDAVYGDNRSLRVWLEQQDLHFVLAVANNQYVWPDSTGQKTVAQLAATVQLQDWVRLSAGDGTKGPRYYDWLRIPLLSWQMPGERWLLLRRRLTDGELAYYVCYVPPGTDLQTLVQVAGSRWTVEECFAAAKGEVGLDHYEVRSWHGWYRHMTLAMAALAYLAVLCARAKEPSAAKKTANG